MSKQIEDPSNRDSNEVKIIKAFTRFTIAFLAFHVSHLFQDNNEKSNVIKFHSSFLFQSLALSLGFTRTLSCDGMLRTERTSIRKFWIKIISTKTGFYESELKTIVLITFLHLISSDKSERNSQSANQVEPKLRRKSVASCGHRWTILMFVILANLCLCSFILLEPFIFLARCNYFKGNTGSRPPCCEKYHETHI